MGIFDFLFGKKPANNSPSQPNSEAPFGNRKSGTHLVDFVVNTDPIWKATFPRNFAPRYVQEFWECKDNQAAKIVIDRIRSEYKDLSAKDFAKEVIRLVVPVIIDSRKTFSIPFASSAKKLDNAAKDWEWYGPLLAHSYNSPVSQLHILCYSEAYSQCWGNWLIAELRSNKGKLNLSKIPMLESSLKHLPIMDEPDRLKFLQDFVRQNSTMAPWLADVEQSIEIQKLHVFLLPLIPTEQWISRKELNTAAKKALNPQNSYSIAKTLSAMENLWMIESKREGSETFFRLGWA
jgi:hypothetical protein